MGAVMTILALHQHRDFGFIDNLAGFIAHHGAGNAAAAMGSNDD
jgi:hypothetical protein